MKKLLCVLAFFTILISCDSGSYSELDYYRAIFAQDVQAVKKILKKTNNPYPKLEEQDRQTLINEFGTTVPVAFFTGMHPLFWAAQSGNVTILEELLKYGSDAGVKNSSGQQALTFAVQSGSAKAVEVLLKAGANVFSADSAGKTALHHAAESAAIIDIAQLLLGAGAAVNAADNRNVTPLMYAAQSNAVHLIQFFIENGAAKEAADSQNETAVFYACRNDSVQALKALLELDAALSIENTDGETPLHAAIKGGFYGVITVLLESDYSIHIEDALNFAVAQDLPDITRKLLEAGAFAGDSLYLAKSAGMFRLLLEMGADIFANQRALIQAIVYGPPHMIDELYNAVYAGISHDGKRDLTTLDNSTAFALLYAAAGTGHLDLVKAFANDGFTIKQIPPLLEGEKTLLWMAVRSNSTEVAAYLFENGFDANAYGDNALYTAVQIENAGALVSLLLEAGAAAAGRSGGSFEIPLADSLAEYVPLLTAAGAQVNAADYYGVTPLLHSMNRPDFSTEKTAALLEAGADPYIADERAVCAADLLLDALENEPVAEEWIKTAHAFIESEKKGGSKKNILSYAAVKNRLNVCRRLFEAGADISAHDKDGKTALIHAAEQGSTAAVEWLIQNGADIEAADDMGRTALQRAKELSGKSEPADGDFETVIKLLLSAGQSAVQ